MQYTCALSVPGSIVSHCLAPLHEYFVKVRMFLAENLFAVYEMILHMKDHFQVCLMSTGSLRSLIG